MRVTLIAVLLGVTGAGILLLRVGGWYFEHRSGSAKSVGAAGVLVEFAFLFSPLRSSGLFAFNTCSGELA
jgi:hypothetical protein